MGRVFKWKQEIMLPVSLNFNVDIEDYLIFSWITLNIHIWIISIEKDKKKTIVLSEVKQMPFFDREKPAQCYLSLYLGADP